MPFVLDASIAAVWALADESDPIAEGILTRWLAGPEKREIAYVPALWWFEIRNVLTVAERRKRITAEKTDRFLRDLALYPIVEDNDRDQQGIFRLAREWRLSFYDAAYLALAIRRGVALATLDQAMRAAAQKSGVTLLH